MPASPGEFLDRDARRGPQTTARADRPAAHCGRFGACVDDPYDGWTAEDARLRSRAALRRNGCSVLDICAESAERHRERFRVWGGRGLPPTFAQPASNEEIDAHVWMDPVPKRPRDPGRPPPKDRPMTRTNAKTIKPAAPANSICRCGCGEPAARNYRPGHDARHVGQLVAIAKTELPGIPDHEGAKALHELLPTEPLVNAREASSIRLPPSEMSRVASCRSRGSVNERPSARMRPEPRSTQTGPAPLTKTSVADGSATRPASSPNPSGTRRCSPERVAMNVARSCCGVSSLWERGYTPPTVQNQLPTERVSELNGTKPALTEQVTE